MKYRRFGRTGLQMPVISCGGMRYQHKWQDVPPKEIPPSQSGQSRSLHPSRPRTRHQPYRDRPRLRYFGMQLGRVLPKLPRDKMIVQTKVAPRATARGIHRNVRHLDEVSATRPRGAAHIARNQQPAAARLVIEERRFVSTPRANCRRKGVANSSASPRMPRRTSSMEAIAAASFDYVNLHWYFVNDSELVVASRLRTRKGHGRVHHQPERQGWETLRSARRSWSSFARR
jgi:hypothetical protein